MAQARADQVVGDLTVQDPVARLVHRHHIGQQVVQLEYLHAPVDHLGDEVEVIPSSLLQPDDIVEQQFLARLRGEPLMGEPWRADQDSPQLARLGEDAESIGRHSTARFPVTINATDTTDVSATTVKTTSSALVKICSSLSRRAQR